MPDELVPVFDTKLVGDILRVSIFDKPIKNKLVHIRLGNSEYIPSKADMDNLCTELTRIVSSDPIHFSNTQVIVTGHDVKISLFSLEKLKKRFTIFWIKNADHYQTLKEQIIAQLTVLKIPQEKFFITRTPIAVDRVVNNAKD